MKTTRTTPARITRTYPGGRTMTMTASVAEHLDTLELTDPETCLRCGAFFELPTMTEIKRPRARTADGFACPEHADGCLAAAAAGRAL